MEKDSMKSLVKRFRGGGGISNQELNALIEFYSKMEEGLEVMGIRHHFSWRDCYDQMVRLKEMKKERLKK